MLTGITDIELLPPATGEMDLVNQIRNLLVVRKKFILNCYER